MYYRVVWNHGILCTSETYCFLCITEWFGTLVVYVQSGSYVVVSPCGLLLCVPWFGSELYVILESGRDVELA